jgi:hypothetical protein
MAEEFLDGDDVAFAWGRFRNRHKTPILLLRLWLFSTLDQSDSFAKIATVWTSQHLFFEQAGGDQLINHLIHRLLCVASARVLPSLTVGSSAATSMHGIV